MRESELTYNWSEHIGVKKVTPSYPTHIEDESLRDGLQGTHATRPTLDQQKRYLELLSEIGIEYVNIGFPSSGERQKAEASELVQHTIQKGLNLSLTCATRALPSDIKHIVDISQENGGYPLEAGNFLGSSRLRSLANRWDKKELIRLTKESVNFGKKNGLKVMFIPEDATRAHPEDLKELCVVALDSGADRICIPDTVGIANERTTRNIIRYVFEEIASKYPNMKVDWHGHNDRGLGLANCIVAAEEGINRIHATTLCIGERAGNVDLAQLILNLNLEGYRSDDMTKLQELADYSAKIFEMSIPANAPIIGKDAHGTSSGVHADAILKSLAQGNRALASRVYSAYDPAMVGREIDIRVGTMSGESNVIWNLNKLGHEPKPEKVEAVLKRAKEGSNKILTDENILEIIQEKFDPKEISQSKELPKNFGVEQISLADYSIISAGVQFDIFNKISEGENSFEQLSKSVPKEILPALLDALAIFGYIERSNNGISLSPSAEKFLTANSQENILELFQNSDWYLMPIAGSRAVAQGETPSVSEETYNRIIDISKKIGTEALGHITSDFPQLLTNNLSVLDVGSGKMGVFAEIGRQNERLKITSVERNQYALQHLKELKEKEFGDRLQIVESDATNIQGLNQEFDFIYLSHVLHWIKEDQIGDLIQLCKDRLLPDGVLIIHEDYLPVNGSAPKESVRKNLILSFLGYRIPTEREMENFLRSSGISSVSSKTLNDRRLLIYARNA